MKKFLLLLSLTVCLAVSCPGCKSAGQTIQEYGSAFVDTVNGMESSGADYGADIYMPLDMDLSWSPFGFEGGIPGAYMKFWVKQGKEINVPAEADTIITTGTN